VKEYPPQDTQFPLASLKAPLLPYDAYQTAHEGLVMSCHDVVIFQEGRALLINRREHPARGILWPIGGRLARGLQTEDSLRQKVHLETGLELDEIGFLGAGRTMFAEEPFGHQRGTDTLNLMYAATARGTLSLDDLHEQPLWVRFGDYTHAFRAALHPYTADIMDMAWQWANAKKLIG